MTVVIMDFHILVSSSTMPDFWTSTIISALYNFNVNPAQSVALVPATLGMCSGSSSSISNAPTHTHTGGAV